MKTRREIKHEMLLTFMANARPNKPNRKQSPVKPKFLKTLLSLFI